MKQAIVNGATGFIGSALVRQLVADGVEVLGLGRRAADALPTHRLPSPERFRYRTLTLDDTERLPDVVREAGFPVDDCVFFNIAWWGTDKVSDFGVHAQLRNVVRATSSLAASAAVGCRLFVHAGSMEEHFAEAYVGLDYHQSNASNRHIIYALSKCGAKRMLKMLHADSPTPVVLTTFSHVMGVDDGKDSFLQVALDKFLHGGDLSFTSGEQIFDTIHVSDVVRGLVSVGKHGRPGQDYWIGSGQARRLREYVEEMARLYPPGQELGFGRVSFSDVILPKELFAIDLIREHTGFEPSVSFEMMVRELAAWLKERRVKAGG